jgi:hypothetical protein
MRISVDLAPLFGREASISFEDTVADTYTDDVRGRLELDLSSFLTVCGGLAVSVINDSVAGHPDPHRPELIEEIMALLQGFAERKTAGADH